MYCSLGKKLQLTSEYTLLVHKTILNEGDRQPILPILQKFQSKVKNNSGRLIVYMPNYVIERDLNIPPDQRRNHKSLSEIS